MASRKLTAITDGRESGRGFNWFLRCNKTPQEPVVDGPASLFDVFFLPCARLASDADSR